MQIRRPLLLPFFGFLLLAAPSAAYAQIDVGVSVQIAPPILPIYAQPPLPELGYIWTPGYWAYGDTGYFWVPGTWVEPPQVGFLWTPGYWAWGNGGYLWNAGYWGPTVGYYGGINYGYGYGGNGYQGGRWNNGSFAYNRAANNFGSVHVAAVFNTPISHSSTRVSFNGGHGGTTAHATTAQQSAAHETHAPLTSAQTSHVEAARATPALAAAQNHGRPAIAATSRPGELTGSGVVAARAAPQHTANRSTAPAQRPAVQHAAVQHAPVRHATVQRAPAQTRAAAQPQARAPAPAVRAAQTPQARPAAPARPAAQTAPAPHAEPAEHAAPDAAPDEHR
jgi:hypothetical protein